MAYDVTWKKTYPHPNAALAEVAQSTLAQLGGKATKKNKPAAGKLAFNFNKKVGSEPMTNRCELEVNLTQVDSNNTELALLCYPVNPIGQKLTFGVRGKPALKVAEAFVKSLEEQLAA